jgi:hypothetical protein
VCEQVGALDLRFPTAANPANEICSGFGPVIPLLVTDVLSSLPKRGLGEGTRVAAPATGFLTEAAGVVGDAGLAERIEPPRVR